MYRDASNYKQHGHVVLTGEITADQEAVVRANLAVDDTFLPDQVGLPTLQESWETHYDDDHVWHELVAFEVTEAPSDLGLSAADFVAGFVDVVWDVDAAANKLQEFLRNTPKGR